MVLEGVSIVFTISLQQAHTEQPTEIGSKALHLSHLYEQGVQIPTGFVIKAQTLVEFMTTYQFDWQDAGFLEAFLAAPLPINMAEEIIAAYQQLKYETGDEALSVAVRSSSSAEDLEDASFAGQYDTILHVRTEQEVLQAVKQCWASVFSEHARDYATQKNISLADFPMSVFVQQMVFADVSGVIFSMNPVTENRDELIINASYGLGEGIVSGLVTPDTFIVHKHTKAIDKDLGFKEMKLIAQSEGIIEVETTTEEQNMYSLEDAMILEIEAITEKLEAFYSFAVDIEFAVKDNELFILQSRPITA